MSGKLSCIIGSFIIAVLVGACGGGGSNKTSSTMATSTPAATSNLSVASTEQAFPTPAAGSTPTPLIAGPDVRPCAAVDLKAGVHHIATDSQVLATIRLGNRSATSCQIRRLPDIRLQDERTQDLPITVSSGEIEDCPAPVLCIFRQPIVLLPGVGLDPNTDPLPGQAWIQLGWYTGASNGACPAEPPRATFVVLTLPDNASQFGVDVVSELPDGIAPCDGTVQIQGYGPGTGG